MTINYLAIILVSILSFVLGALWFSKLFGKTWMMIHHTEIKTPEEVQASMKSFPLFMVVEFLLTLLMSYFLYFIVVQSISLSSSLITAFYLWLGFILPTTISNVIWGGDDKKFMLKKIAISSGFRLIALLGSAWIFFVWM